MEIKFLLVCEGQTDYFAIDAIAKSLSKALGRKIKVCPISPQQDATSGEWPRHGWSAVRSWCRLYGNKTEQQLSKLDPKLRPAAIRRNWRALLKMQNAAGLIIQMDTDIAEKIQDIEPFKHEEIHRKEFCRKAALSWINEQEIPIGIYLALTTYSLEAWLLATHNRDHEAFSDLTENFNYEEIADIEDRLIQIGYPSAIKNGNRRLSKRERDYKSYAKKIAAELNTVRVRCTSAEDLCNYLETTQ